MIVWPELSIWGKIASELRYNFKYVTIDNPIYMEYASWNHSGINHNWKIRMLHGILNQTTVEVYDVLRVKLRTPQDNLRIVYA